MAGDISKATTNEVDPAFRKQKIQQAFGVGPEDPREALEAVLYPLAVEKLGTPQRSKTGLGKA